MIREVSADEFDVQVRQAAGPVLVDFWGPRCRPCLALMPAVERLARVYTGRVTVVKVNASVHPQLCRALHVWGLPTFVLFTSGQERARLAGDDVTEGAIAGLLAEASGDPGPEGPWDGGSAVR